jgi:hypothetical protein
MLVAQTELKFNRKGKAVEGRVVIRDGHLVGAGTWRVSETGTQVTLRDGDVVAVWHIKAGSGARLIVLRVNRDELKLVGYIDTATSVDRVGRADLEVIRAVLKAAPLPPVVKEAARTLRWRIVGRLIRELAGPLATPQPAIA